MTRRVGSRESAGARHCQVSAVLRGVFTHVKVAVLTGSLAAALLATIILRLRNRTYRRIHNAETIDENRDDIPDIYQQETRGSG